jgi:transcriptional regulator with XRE-family HTH domain
MEETPMTNPRTVADLCVEAGLDARQLAERCGLDESRVAAILLRRWTPSPADRQAIARVLGREPGEIIWGHATPVQHIYGAGPG